jgi:hypothetical protein
MRFKPQPQHGDDGDGEKDPREGQQNVHEPHDEVVRHAAVVAAEHPEQGAEHQGDQHGHHLDLERHLGAVDDPAQDVAAQGIRAQPVPHAGGLEPLVEIAFVGGVGRDDRCQDRHGHEKQNDHAAADGRLVAFQPAPDLGGLRGFLNSICHKKLEKRPLVLITS